MRLEQIIQATTLHVLLHVHQEVPLENVFAFLVLLIHIVREILIKVYVADGMVSGGHLALARFAFGHVDYSVEEIRPAVLSIECSGYHGVNGRQVRLALESPIYA